MRRAGWLVAGLLVAVGVYMALPRGIRNNNPGNIRFNSANDWDGQAGRDSAGFAVFDSSKWGLRALAKLLRNYHRSGLTTIAQIIGRYAPANENNTGAYIDSVAYALAESPAGYLDLDDPEIITALMAAIVKHENGFNPYSQKEMNDALALALA